MIWPSRLLFFFPRPASHGAYVGEGKADVHADDAVSPAAPPLASSPIIKNVYKVSEGQTFPSQHCWQLQLTPSPAITDLMVNSPFLPFSLHPNVINRRRAMSNTCVCKEQLLSPSTMASSPSLRYNVLNLSRGVRVSPKALFYGKHPAFEQQW